MKNKSSIDGSPSCLQFGSGISSKAIADFISQLETVTNALDTEGLKQLQILFPNIINVGKDDFYKDVLELMQANIKSGLENLNKRDGYCQNCLPNYPVVMFGNNRHKIAYYYHFEANDPVEIHLCTFCDEKKCSKDENTFEWFSKNFSAKNRPPKILELLLKLGESLVTRDIDKFQDLFLEDVTYDRSIGSSLIIGKTAVTKKIQQVFDNQRKQEVIPNIEVVFLGDNDGPCEKLEDFNGLPMLSIKLLGKNSFLEIKEQNGLIIKLITFPSFMVDFGKIEELTYTGYFINTSQ